MVIETNTEEGPSSTVSTSRIATETLPQAIAAATKVTQAAGYTLITIGFKKELNYPFAVSNPIANAQIFQYLPQVLASPFEDKSNKFQNTSVLQLVPLKVDKKDYLVTVAQVYFPQDSTNALEALMLNTSSDFYKNPDGLLKQLASYIDPSIPLTGLVESGSDSLISGGYNGGSGSEFNSNSGSGSNSDSDSNGSSKGGSKSKGGINLGSLDDNAYSTRSRLSSSTSGKSSNEGMDGKKIGILVGSIAAGAIVALGGIYLLALRIRKQKKQILANPVADDQQSYDSYDYESSFDYNAGYEKDHAMNDDQVSISPSAKINNWIDYNTYNEYPEDTQPTTNGIHGQRPPMPSSKTSNLKISRPIATENSLGWSDL